MLLIKIWIFILFLTNIESIEIIQGFKILLSSNMSIPVPNNKCQEIIIPNNYKKLNLTLISEEISDLLLTDKKIENCPNNLLIEDCCEDNSTFCMGNINPLYNFFNLYYCLELSYIYICAKNNNKTSYLSIETNVIKGEGCQIAEYTDETECATVGIENCKNQNTCNRKCQYVNCMTEKGKHIFGMCLPINMTDDVIFDKCNNHINFDENGKFQKTLCEKQNERTKNDRSGFHQFIKIIFILIGVIGLGVFMSSIYYRFKIKIDINRSPFNPPWWCPNFIFPKVNKTITAF